MKVSRFFCSRLYLKVMQVCNHSVFYFSILLHLWFRGCMYFPRECHERIVKVNVLVPQGIFGSPLREFDLHVYSSSYAATALHSGWSSYWAGSEKLVNFPTAVLKFSKWAIWFFWIIWQKESFLNHFINFNQVFHFKKYEANLFVNLDQIFCKSIIGQNCGKIFH